MADIFQKTFSLQLTQKNPGNKTFSGTTTYIKNRYLLYYWQHCNYASGQVLHVEEVRGKKQKLNGKKK